MAVEFIIYRGVSVRKGDESLYDPLIDKLEQFEAEYRKHSELGKQAREKLEACKKQIDKLTSDLR